MPARRTLHWWLTNFVDWLKPDDAMNAKIRTQATEIRSRISARARADGLIIRSTPNSGSFAKKTGLRRHMPGGSNVNGMDVDLPFVVSPRTKDEADIHSLLDRFMRYAEASYPYTTKEKRKRSIQLDFTASNLSYDLVPMLAGDTLEEQIIVRSTGERQDTSVQKHISFITTRTNQSNAIGGRVKFNECIRLVKWWREFRQDDSELKVPSFLIGLLCGDAYDRYGVEEHYPETLAKWFGWCAHVVRERQRIAFTDFESIPEADPLARWEALDPVNPINNVVSAWSGWQIDELAEWLEEGRDSWNRIMASEALNDEHAMKRELITLFGTPFKHHCEGE